MNARPYVILSCAVSLDGYIDDATDTRLVLSNNADLDRVDAMRADCDAILVGAGTVRRDDPGLLVRSSQRRAARTSAGGPENPVKVTLTATGDLDPAARFFTTGNGEKLVYCAGPALASISRLRAAATIVDAGDPLDLTVLLADLAARGVRRLLVEGGSAVHTGFLAASLADEVCLAIAPFLVGDPMAPRFVRAGTFPQSPGDPMRLTEVRQLGDVAVLRYLTGGAVDE
ncbi:MAG: RibD family protein [Streptosporangiales bacterium]